MSRSPISLLINSSPITGMVAMGVIKFTVPDELEARLRQAVGSKKGLRRGALSESLEEAVRAWVRPSKPTLSIYSGYHFEMSNECVEPFLEEVVTTLLPARIKISYPVNGEESDRPVLEDGYVLVECSSSDFRGTLPSISAAATSPGLVMEMDENILYSAGNGCFFLDAPLAGYDLYRLGRRLLTASIPNQEALSAALSKLDALSQMDLNRSKFELHLWDQGEEEVKLL